MPGSGKRGSWSFLTSHGHVLVEIARNPEALMKDLSVAVGISERATAGIVSDLEAAGYVTRARNGRRNRYVVHLERGFRHPALRNVQIGPLLTFLIGAQPPQATSGTGFTASVADGDETAADSS